MKKFVFIVSSYIFSLLLSFVVLFLVYYISISLLPEPAICNNAVCAIPILIFVFSPFILPFTVAPLLTIFIRRYLIKHVKSAVSFRIMLAGLMLCSMLLLSLYYIYINQLKEENNFRQSLPSAAVGAVKIAECNLLNNKG